MPIEIRELHIKVRVDSHDATGPAGGGGGAGTSGNGGESDRESLVAECVEQVLHVLRQKLER